MTSARRTIDWQQVHRRLEQSKAALERSISTDPERMRQILDRRAQRLAIREQQAATASLTLLVFELGSQRYGLPMRDVIRVAIAAHISPVPGGPTELVGVTNIDGEIRSVISLRLLLGLSPADAVGRSHLLRMRGRERGSEVVLQVDDVTDLVDVDPEQLLDFPPRSAAESLARGLTPSGVILLNKEALLEQPVFRSL